MKRIRLSKWEKYKSIIGEFMDEDAARKSITWLKHVDNPLAYGEDVGSTFIQLELMALVADNSYRTWPVNQTTVSGEVDNQSMAVWVSKRYLETNDLLTPEGYFDFDMSKDRIIIDGVLYKPAGDTQASQANDETLLFMIVLKRDKDDVNKLNILTE